MPTSASPKARKNFDYVNLDAETSRFVQQQTGEIRALMKRTAQGIVEIGQKLIEVKERLGHGQFGDWLEAEFEWSWDTAGRFINVATRFSDFPQFAEFAPSALYVLSAPSTPESARNEALTRAKAGESITYTAAKAIKQKYATPTTPKLEPPQPELKPVSQPPLIPALSPQSASKLEIVAIHRQAQPPALELDPALIVQQSPVSEPDVPGVWWQLGGKHLLYCGDPNSPEFLGRITEEVQLLLAFPLVPNWQSGSRARTIISLTTPQYSAQGNDSRMFEDMVELMLLLYSNVGDTVVNCILPTPDILSIINRLDRKGVIAEPDPKRCNAVISDWKKAGLKVERIN